MQKECEKNETAKRKKVNELHKLCCHKDYILYFFYGCAEQRMASRLMKDCFKEMTIDDLDEEMDLTKLNNNDVAGINLHIWSALWGDVWGLRSRNLKKPCTLGETNREGKTMGSGIRQVCAANTADTSDKEDFIANLAAM